MPKSKKHSKKHKHYDSDSDDSSSSADDSAEEVRKKKERKKKKKLKRSKAGSHSNTNESDSAMSDDSSNSSNSSSETSKKKRKKSKSRKKKSKNKSPEDNSRIEQLRRSDPNVTSTSKWDSPADQPIVPLDKRHRSRSSVDDNQGLNTNNREQFQNENARGDDREARYARELSEPRRPREQRNSDDEDNNRRQYEREPRNFRRDNERDARTNTSRETSSRDDHRRGGNDGDTRDDKRRFEHRDNQEEHRRGGNDPDRRRYDRDDQSRDRRRDDSKERRNPERNWGNFRRDDEPNRGQRDRDRKFDNNADSGRNWNHDDRPPRNDNRPNNFGRQFNNRNNDTRDNFRPNFRNRGDDADRKPNDRQDNFNRGNSDRSPDARGRGNGNRGGNFRKRRGGSQDDGNNYEWGKKSDKVEENGDEEKPVEKEKPDFGLSGKLTEDTNKVNGIVIKYAEPPEARKTKNRWRLYIFKDDKLLNILHIHRQSCFLIGRERKLCDVAVDHPSCSQQHAVLQYRLVPFTRDDGSTGKRVRPYIIDLESSNGTFVNNTRIDPRKYVELLERDVIKFAFSTREYVILHENSKEDGPDADVLIEEEPLDPNVNVKVEND